MPTNRRFRRGVYLLPSLFTVGNLLCGFSAIVYAANGSFRTSALLVIVAGILDGLDGRIARLTGTTSDFGLQFDSLADIVSFGVAPAALAYHWALTPLNRSGWLIAFLYVVCTAMRLARFNIRNVTSDKRFFAGLPSPSAAGAVASIAFVFPESTEIRWISVLLALLVTSIALLMISRFRYRSFKDFDLRNRRSYVQILPIAALLVGLFSVPEVLLGLAAWYVTSGPVGYVWGLVRRGHGEAREVADEPALR